SRQGALFQRHDSLLTKQWSAGGPMAYHGLHRGKAYGRTADVGFARAVFAHLRYPHAGQVRRRTRPGSAARVCDSSALKLGAAARHTGRGIRTSRAARPDPTDTRSYRGPRETGCRAVDRVERETRAEGPPRLLRRLVDAWPRSYVPSDHEPRRAAGSIGQ